jgi:ABC-type Mn2+/Zn2+ transport system permease subunit
MTAPSRDLALGSVMLAVALAYYWLTTQVPESALDDAVGPVGLPRFYAIMLVVLCVVVIVRSLLVMSRRTSQQGDDVPRWSWRFAGMLLIGVVYVAIVPWLGYLLSIALLIASTAWYQGGTLHRRVVIVAASGALLLWLLFVAILRIPQPPGAWTSIF